MILRQDSCLDSCISQDQAFAFVIRTRNTDTTYIQYILLADLLSSRELSFVELIIATDLQGSVLTVPIITAASTTFQPPQQHSFEAFGKWVCNSKGRENPSLERNALHSKPGNDAC